MVRLTVDVDDRMLARAMRRFGLESESAAIDLALRRLVGELTHEEALAMRGTGWDGDLGELRDGGVSLT